MTKAVCSDGNTPTWKDRETGSILKFNCIISIKGDKFWAIKLAKSFQ